MIWRSQAGLVAVNWNCKVEVRRIPGLNPRAIIQKPKGLVRGVPAGLRYCLLCLTEHVLLNSILRYELFCLSMNMI